MKKIFLSLPMKNRSDEAIKNTIEGMKRILEAYYPDEVLEFIDNFDAGWDISKKMIDDTEHPSLLYLSKAIFRMANCTHIAMIKAHVIYQTGEDYHGCYIEDEVARAYNILPIYISDEYGDILLPDLVEKAKNQRFAETMADEACKY